MFEDFKDKIREHSSNNIEKTESMSLSPEVLEKLKQQGIDPENVTLAQLFPECLDPDGNDLSLMSGDEWEIMITYAKTRKYLLEKYLAVARRSKNAGAVLGGRTRRALSD